MNAYNPDHSLRGYDRALADTAPVAFPCDRGDGFHANDPATPAAWHCDGCDAVRDHRRMFCASCNEVTSAWREGEALRLVASIEAQLADPTYAARRDAGQAAIDALFSAHDARERARQEARWALEAGEGL
jgi:hypothetical protein